MSDRYTCPCGENHAYPSLCPSEAAPGNGGLIIATPTMRDLDALKTEIARLSGQVEALERAIRAITTHPMLMNGMGGILGG